MAHLDDEQILRAARAAAPTGHAAHLRDCARCAGEVESMRALAAAATAADLAATGPVTAPSFDALIAPALAPARAQTTVVAPAAAASWRLTAQLVLRQARLVPRALWPLTALGFAALLLLAWQAGPVPGAVLTGPGVTLVVMLGALAVCEPRRDPRRELLYALPVPPVAVWLSRLAFVLAVDLAMAAGASVVIAALPRSQAGPIDVIASWLGPALLSAALAAFGAVWRSPLVGAGLGLGAWGLGVAAIARTGEGALDAVGTAVWTTGPLTLGAAAALLAAAAVLVSRPARVLADS